MKKRDFSVAEHILLAFACFAIAWMVANVAFAEQVEVTTIELTVTVQAVDQTKICAKAIAVLTKAANIFDPVAFVSIDGKPNTGKCLEAIFSELSSPTNGYRVVAVQRGDL